MSDPYERESARAAMRTLQQTLIRVTKQRDDLSKMISAFCVEQNWACSEWKNQTHIKPLFDFHASMKGGAQ
jgi:hypothetical protein